MDITLRDIQAIARQESEELLHYFVGVEHLFLGLTRLKGGLTEQLLEQRGLLGYFLEAMIKEAYQTADEQRFWPDFRITERAQKVLDNAAQLVRNGVEPEDRALLIAILEDGESMPIRVLQELGADFASLTSDVNGWTGHAPGIVPPIPITVEDDNARLEPAQEKLLRLMFRGADRIYIKRALTDGFGGSTVLLVQVRQTIMNAPVVVKLDDKQAIQYEKMRYDQFVKGILPPNTSSIMDDPSFLTDQALGGIKYTFVSKPDSNGPVNARQFAAVNGPRALEKFIKGAVYDSFKPYWWGQGQPVRFQVWAEYELLLPAALVVQIVKDDSATATNMRRLHPGGEWSRRGGVNVGEMVILEEFIAQKVKPEKGLLTLTAGAGSDASSRSSRVDVRGLDFENEQYLRGQTVQPLVGRVIQTRSDLLSEQVQALEPNFEIAAETIPTPFGTNLPNPLNMIPRMLESWIDGRMSPIHGDLHTGNILVGPAGDAWLIDFEWTRQGHALFDWAILETSLLIDLIAPILDGSWESVWTVIRGLDALNRTGQLPTDLPAEVYKWMRPVHGLREIVKEQLAGGLWSEYYKALAMTSLRVPSWTTRPLVSRRLTFLASALYIEAARLTDNDYRQTETISKTISDMLNKTSRPE